MANAGPVTEELEVSGQKGTKRELLALVSART